jgi:hypothetical protein
MSLCGQYKVHHGRGLSPHGQKGILHFVCISHLSRTKNLHIIELWQDFDLEEEEEEVQSP